MHKATILILAIVAFLVLTSTTFASPPAKRWQYQEFFVDTSVTWRYPALPLIIDQQRFGVVYQGDMAITTKFCQPSDELYCVISKFITFAIPKGFPEGPATWQKAGLEFRVWQHYPSMKILGKVFDIYLIKATDPEESEYEYQYLYSPKNGLIAFGRVKNGGGINGYFHWLVGLCGFPIEHCKSE